MNKFNLIFALFFFCASIVSAEPNCDSLRIQRNELNRNLKTELFATAGIGLFSGAIFMLTWHTDMKTIDNKTYAIWGVSIGLPVGALVVTTVGAIKKIKFNIENRNKC